MGIGMILGTYKGRTGISSEGDCTVPTMTKIDGMSDTTCANY